MWKTRETIPAQGALIMFDHDNYKYRGIGQYHNGIIDTPAGAREFNTIDRWIDIEHAVARMGLYKRTQQRFIEQRDTYEKALNMAIAYIQGIALDYDSPSAMKLLGDIHKMIKGA